MAESFVNTFKRDYVSPMNVANARAVMAQVAAAFEHFKDLHPDSALKMKSPTEFTRHRAVQQRLAQIEQPLHCE